MPVNLLNSVLLLKVMTVGTPLIPCNADSSAPSSVSISYTEVKLMSLSFAYFFSVLHGPHQDALNKIVSITVDTL